MVLGVRLGRNIGHNQVQKILLGKVYLCVQIKTPAIYSRGFLSLFWMDLKWLMITIKWTLHNEFLLDQMDSDNILTFLNLEKLLFSHQLELQIGLGQ